MRGKSSCGMASYAKHVGYFVFLCEGAGSESRLKLGEFAGVDRFSRSPVWRAVVPVAVNPP